MNHAQSSQSFWLGILPGTKAMEVRLNLITQFSLKWSTTEKNHAWISIFCFNLKTWIVDHCISTSSRWLQTVAEVFKTFACKQIKIHVWQFILTFHLFSTWNCYPQQKASVRFSSGLTDGGKGQKLITLPRNGYDYRVKDLGLSLSWGICNFHLYESRTGPGIFSSPRHVSRDVRSSASSLSWSTWLLAGGRQDAVTELPPWH